MKSSMDEKSNRKNIYLIDKIARKASCRRAILSYNETDEIFKKKKLETFF